MSDSVMWCTCGRFPALLRELDSQKAALLVRSYGVSVTTMEEARVSRVLLQLAARKACVCERVSCAALHAVVAQ